MSIDLAFWVFFVFPIAGLPALDRRRGRMLELQSGLHFVSFVQVHMSDGFRDRLMVYRYVEVYV